MITDSLFAFACAGLIGMLFGTMLAFMGYRFFIFLLPIWGFFFGLALGAQSIQVLLGDAFLATITSWVVGFVVGALFAVLSYLFYAIAVAIIGGSLGYVVVVTLLAAIGMDFGFIMWLIGIIAAVAMAFVTIRFDLQRWVVIVATSFLGTSMIFATIILMFNPLAQFLENPVQLFLSVSPFLTVLAVVIAGLGIFVQAKTSPSAIVEYNRLQETTV